MFKKILIANRGEIACRIMRTARRMGIATVAVYSDADAGTPHVMMADEAVHIGGAASADSYLRGERIIAAAKETGAEAIHPGFGFLSENAGFVAEVEAAGLVFIGPGTKAIAVMGDKIESKALAKSAGVSTVPGTEGEVDDVEVGLKAAAEIGYPVMVKASAGGGGKGMRVIESADDLPDGMRAAMSEAQTAFGDSRVFIEKFVVQPRHIEIQLLADQHGNIVYVGERECSIQRRHQKLFEEAPSPVLSADQRAEIGGIAAEATSRMGYLGVGTMEFLYENGEFFFIEMNTRLQVEHPITEAITGVDLVREQIRIAAGNELSFRQEDVTFTGHAIECRINAEHPETFMPTPGKVTAFHAAGGSGIRVDSCLYSGYSVPPYYDSLIAKLIVHGDDRAHCLARLKRALSEFVVEPIPTTLDLHERLVDAPAVLDGSYNIRRLEEHFLSDD